MATRRELIKALVGAGLVDVAPTTVAATKLEQQFDSELRLALSDTEAVERARQFRDGQIAYYARFGGLRAGRPIPRAQKSGRPIGQRAMEMIIGYEVGGRTYFEKRKLMHPIVPGGDSGVTIGVGYDLGQQNPEWLREDWHGLLTDDVLDRLAKACRKTKEAAKQAAVELGDVSVGWDAAQAEFYSQSLPRYVGFTLHVLPKAAGLSNDSLGALVSLVFNRGASFNNDGANFIEMRAIRDHLAKGQWSAIPDEFRRMVRLWQEPHLSAERAKEVTGLVDRRKVEARLFEVGLKRSTQSQ